MKETYGGGTTEPSLSQSSEFERATELTEKDLLTLGGVALGARFVLRGGPNHMIFYIDSKVYISLVYIATKKLEQETCTYIAAI